jgi:CHASE2 domain-containing sensor protein
MPSALLEKATRQSTRLRLINKIVGIAAIVVYLVTISLAISEGGWFALIPLTSILLGVGLIYTFVETVLTHLELLRDK